MTQPWNPSPNPGGNNRRLVRTILADYLTAAQIPGLLMIWRAFVPTFDVESLAGSGPYAVARIHVGRIVERRMAYTGPTDPGGKDADYETVLEVAHRSAGVENADWEAAEDDHDRIIGAICDQLHASGRDLGRPDVILQAADWPSEQTLVIESGEPYAINGLREQITTMSFVISQYMQRQP